MDGEKKPLEPPGKVLLKLVYTYVYSVYPSALKRDKGKTPLSMEDINGKKHLEIVDLSMAVCGILWLVISLM